MKVGDRILCKEDYDGGNYVVYNKGNYYIIEDIGIISDSPITCEFIRFKDKPKSFSLIYNPGINYFYEYFYDIQEMRRMKLKTIKEGVL